MDIMAYVFRFSKARVKYEPPAPVVEIEPVRYYPNGVRIITKKESWRVAIEEGLANGTLKNWPLVIIPSERRRDFIVPVWTEAEKAAIIKGQKLG